MDSPTHIFLEKSQTKNLLQFIYWGAGSFEMAKKNIIHDPRTTR